MPQITQWLQSCQIYTREGNERIQRPRTGSPCSADAALAVDQEQGETFPLASICPFESPGMEVIMCLLLFRTKYDKNGISH